MLRSVASLDETTLQNGLTQLVESELVYQRGLPPQARYLFKHALVQDAAYQSLLRSRRQQIHQSIAETLEDQFAETKETQPELIAHHYTEAGMAEQAIPYWQIAGEQAINRSAHIEASNHLLKGLEVFETLPNLSEHTSQELSLQLPLGMSYMISKGFASPEVEKRLARVQELCQQVGESPRLLLVLPFVSGFQVTRGNIRTSQELAKQLFSLSEKLHKPMATLHASYGLGESAFWLGDLVSARTYLEYGTTLSAFRDPAPLALRSIHHPGVAILAILGRALWILGYPDQAQEKMREARLLSEELSHPASQAFALSFSAAASTFCGNITEAKELATIQRELASEQRFPLWSATSDLYHGWALVEQEQSHKGILQMQRGLAMYTGTGQKLGVPIFFSYIAEASEKMGDYKSGLDAVSQALALMEETEECVSESNLYRLKGELILQEKDQSEQAVEKEAEELFLKAIEIARKQAAKSWELRATMSLVRLWQKQGKQAEARQRLVEVYDWFTEGFETADLIEAKSLLEELS